MTVPLAYFVVNTDALDSDKMRALRMRLRMSPPEGLPIEWLELVVDGVIARLWQLAASRGDNTGSLGNRDAVRLAQALGWPGDPEQLVKELRDIGLLDQLENGEYAPHNWSRHQPAIKERIRKNKANAWKRPEKSGTEPEKSTERERERERSKTPKPPPASPAGASPPKRVDPGGGSPRARGTNPRAKGTNARGPVEEAWRDTLAMAAKVGRYGNPSFDKPTTEAVRAVGWRTLCDVTPKTRAEVKQMFHESYEKATGPPGGDG